MVQRPRSPKTISQKIKEGERRENKRKQQQTKLQPQDNSQQQSMYKYFGSIKRDTAMNIKNRKDLQHRYKHGCENEKPLRIPKVKVAGKRRKNLSVGVPIPLAIIKGSRLPIPT